MKKYSIKNQHENIVNAVEKAIVFLNEKLYDDRLSDQKRYNLSLIEYNKIFHPFNSNIKGQLKQMHADIGKKTGAMLEKYIALELSKDNINSIFDGASGYDINLYSKKWEIKTTSIYDDSPVTTFSGNMHGIKVADWWLFIALKYDEMYSIYTHFCVIIVNDEEIVATKKLWEKYVKNNTEKVRENNSFLTLKFLSEDFDNLYIYKGSKSKLTPTGRDSMYVTFKPLGEIPNVKKYKR